MTAAEMAEKWGGTRQSYSDLHKRGRLQIFLDNPEEFQRQRYCKNDTKYIRAYGMVMTDIMKFLGLTNPHSVYDLDRAGLLHHCIKITEKNIRTI